jgi:hypothetical protein
MIPALRTLLIPAMALPVTLRVFFIVAPDNA